MSKFVKTLVVIVGVLFILLTIFGLVLLIKFGFNLKSAMTGSESNRMIAKKELEYSNTINLETNSGSVEIIVADDDKIKVELYADHLDKYEIKETDKAINVKVNEKSLNFFKRLFDHKIAKIVMYLPKDYDGNINIKSNVGRVGIDNFVKASIDIDSDVADIDIYEVKNLKVRLNVGDIQVGSINNSLDLNTDVASVNITTVNIKEDSRIKVNVGDVTILNTNDIYIDGETKTGTVKIYKNNHEADITLKIRNDVGDIEVYNDEIINDDVKLVSELEEYKKLDLEKIDSIEVIRYTEGGDIHEEMTEVEDIKKYYELIGSTKLGRETPESCEDNTTVYVFKMGKDKVSFEFECGNFVYNGKRYIIKK